MAAHKPLPSLPNPEGPFRSTTLSAQAKTHRGQLLRHFLQHDVDQPEPAFTPRQQEAWVGVIERSLDDIGDLVAQQDWLTAVGKGRVVKERWSKSVATASAPTEGTPDKPLPELDPLRIVRTLATRPKPATKKPRPSHLVLCVAPLRGGDLPVEDSGFDIVPANLVCIFKPGRYYVEEGTILYGLQGISNETLETPISLVGGSFVLKGVTTHRQHQRLRNLLHIAVYIHLSLILEQHLFVNSHVAIQYSVPPSEVPPPNDAPVEPIPTNNDPQQGNSKEDYTLFAWSSNLRKRATMIPSSFNFGNFNFFARRNSIGNPAPPQPRNGGSLDLPSYNWSANKGDRPRKSIEAPTTPLKLPPASAAADPASTNDPPLTPPSTSTTPASTSQPAQTQPPSQPPPPQPQPEVQTPPADTQVQPPSEAEPHPHRLHRLSFRAVGGLNGERKPLAAALRRRPTVAGTKPEVPNHTRPLSVWSFLPGSSSSTSPQPAPPNPNTNGANHPGPSSNGNTASNENDNNGASSSGGGPAGGLYDASTGPPPALPFSTALARLEESKALLSTSPNLQIPPPKLLVDLAEKEKSYHLYERDSQGNAANLTRRRQEQRGYQVALGAGRVGGGSGAGGFGYGHGRAGSSGQWPWWMKGDEKVALSTLMICSSGEEDGFVGLNTQGQGQGQAGPSRHGTGLRALLGLDHDSSAPNSGGSMARRRSPLRCFAMQQSISVLWSVHVPCSPVSGSGIKTGSTKDKGKDKEKEKEKEKEVVQVDDSDPTSSRLTASSTTTVSTSATTATNTSKITTTSSMRDPETLPPSSSSLQTQTIACGKPYRQTYQFYSAPMSSPLHPDTADPSLGSVIHSWINDRHLACEVRPSLCPFERGKHEKRLIHGGVMVSIKVEDGEDEELEKVEEVSKVDVVPGEGNGSEPVSEKVDDEGPAKVDDGPKEDEEKKEQDEDPADPEKKDDPPPDKTPAEDSDLQDIEVVKMQMYLSCSVCGARSKRSTMDHGTALLSFGKFIELVIYSPSFYILGPSLCDHTTPPTPHTTHDGHFSHISPNLLRHFYLPPNPTKPLEPTGQVTLSARPIEDSVFEICLPRMQILNGLGVDGSGKYVNFAPGLNASGGAFRNALALGAGITKKARSFSARRLRRSEGVQGDDDTGGATPQNWRSEEKEKRRDRGAYPGEGEQKRVLRMEIKRWWEGVAARVDQIEKALDEQEKAQDALLSRNPSQARRVQKALPRLPSAHDAYDVFEVLAEGKTADPQTPRSTSVSTTASTSKFTTNSKTDSDAMSTLKESDAEDEGGKTPTPLPPASLLPQEGDEAEEQEETGSGAQTPKAERSASDVTEGKPSDNAPPPSEDAQPPLPTESTVSLAPTLPPKDEVHAKRTTSTSSQGPPPPTTATPAADATPKLEDVQAPPPEQPSILLSSLRHNFHQLEHGLYTQLAKTPEGRLNDVRRSFLSVAKGTEKRLLAWERKHLKSGTGKKTEGGSGIAKREGLSRRNTNESVKLVAPEPEWWGKGCHVLPGGDVIVREGDWGSIIAHTLSSSDYLVELGNMISGRVVSISSTASTGTATGAPSFPSSAPTTPRDDRGTSSSYPSSFFSLPGRYKLFSSPVALPDPDDNGTDWHEQESYFAVVSRKQHHREATPTPVPNHSSGSSTLNSNSSMRDAIIARVPKKETADAQEGIITTATRVAISAVVAPAAILASKPSPSAAPSPQPVVKARADVQVSMEAAKGEINSSGDVDKPVLKDVGGSAPVESPLPDIPAARASLEQVDTQLKRTNANNVSKASEKVVLEAEEGEGDNPKDRVESKGKERMSTDDSASVTTLGPPLPPPKDVRQPQEPPIPPPKPVSKPTNPPTPPAADPAPNPPPTSSGFATALANGLQSVAMRFMMHSEPATRNVTPTQPTIKHHELLASQPLPITQPSLFAVDDRPHIKYEWTIGKRLKFSCTTYYAKQFDLLRKRCGIDDIYIKSLSRSANWAAEGGKSKSNFWKTTDDRFIIKTLVNAWNVADLQVLIELAPSYFRYMESTANKATVLAKLAGFYTIEIRNLETGAVQAKADLLVMENLFYDRHVNKTFDLKGIQGRKVKAKSPTSKTLFDGEWIEGQQRSITLVQPYSKVTMKEAIQTDAEFLAKSNIMDYSLLMGFDQEKRQIACGLVDTIGSFTFAKTLEYKAKHNLQPGTKEVTVMPPNEYQERFVKSLDDYIVACPDKWSKPLDNLRLNDDPTRLPCVL